MLKNINISPKAILHPLIMLSAMWIGFLFQNLGFFSHCYGAIIPLAPDGLKGIFLSPFLHGSWEHIIGNSLPMVVLLFLLYQFYPLIANKIFFTGWLTSGLLVWMLPQIDILSGEFHTSCIIGASGIIYVLAFFLFFSGVFRWDGKLLPISLIVALFYGGLVWGVFPEELLYSLDEPSRISWQSHLTGAIVGVILALMFRKIGEKKRKFIWEYSNYYSEKDDKLWQEYQMLYQDDVKKLPQKNQDPIWERLEKLRKKD